MAKEAAAKPAESAPEPVSEEVQKKKPPVKLVAVALGVVVLEAATVGLTMMLSGGPKRAAAEMPVAATQAVVERDIEVPIVDAKLPNALSGRMYLYDIEVVAKVSEKNKEKLTRLREERRAELTDRIRTIVASSDPKSMEEPGLETLRRQIGYQLEENLGKDLVKELLIPKCMRFRPEF